MLSGAPGDPPGGRIYTRRGDDGSTGLLFGGRVPKDHPRIEACGAIDEAVAALGVARACEPAADGLAGLLLEIQRGLFVVGAEVAAAKESAEKLEPGVSRVTDQMVRGLEGQIDGMVRICPLPDYFVVPGETPAAAALDMARVLVRRAERRVVGVVAEGGLDESEAVRYLNRLSDLLFVAARLEESARGADAPPSRPAGEGP
jgi:cob(I)alamin adenosyltransferase